MKRITLILIGIVSILAIWLVISYFRWEKLPRTSHSIYILDKTISSGDYTEHKSLFWVLSNLRFEKPNKTPYRMDRDYYGFFPIDAEHGTFNFRTIRLAQIERYADSLDAVYYVDCYGVYSESWTMSKNRPLGEKVYGGLNQNDYLLLKAMKERGKMIVAEHNLFSRTGGGLVKEKLTELFGFTWTGWIGRSYSSFDTTKLDRPPSWVVSIYRAEHGSWPNDKGGIIFAKDRDQVVLLFDEKHLTSSRVSVVSTSTTVKEFGVKENLPFSEWFEIIETEPAFSVFSNFSMNLTSEGSAVLTKNGIPETFPAAIGYSNGYQLYYFAGDFSHTPAYMFCSEMINGAAINKCISTVMRPRGFAFFNDYYRPFISKVLTSYTPPIGSADSLETSN